MKIPGLILLLFCFACTSKPKKPEVHINLTNNKQSVKIKGLDYAIISEINRDSVPEVWESLLPVYRMPKDTDLKEYQPVQHGTYTLRDSAVVFTPDTPFVKNQTYFMRYYKFGEGRSVIDLIKSKRKLGNHGYTDMAF